MKIIIVARQLGVQSEHWLKRQIELLKDQVEQVVVLGNSDSDQLYGIPIVALDIEHQVKYKVLTKVLGKPISDYKNKRLAAIFSKSKADAVLFHYIDFTLNFKNLINNTNKKVFVYCHGYDVTWNLKFHQDPNLSYFKDTYKNEVVELSKSVHFIANSKSTQTKLTDIGVSENKIATKYFGVETNSMRSLPNEFTLLYLGRLVDFKGPHLVLQAYDKACRNGLKAKLIFAGDGPLREMIELMRLNSDYKANISILGEVNYAQAKELFKKASIFVAHNCTGPLSNQEEAFGVSIIEAMSFGLPVITGASGGTKETIADGTTGFLFQPFNTDEQANYMLKYYNDRVLLEKHSKNAQDHVRTEFSLEQEYEWYQEIFN